MTVHLLSLIQVKALEGRDCPSTPQPLLQSLSQPAKSLIHIRPQNVASGLLWVLEGGGYTGASQRTMLGAWERGKIGREGKAGRQKNLATFHAQHLALPCHPRTVVTWGSASSVTEARRP